MVRFWKDYHSPTTLDEALVLLAHYQGRARVVAGGTDLFLDLSAAYESGERPCLDALIDITRIEGADALVEQDGYIIIGCGVTHAQIVDSPLIQARATALAEACSVVGGPQVRNVATLIGNVAHALPAADGTIALLALEAEARVNEPMRNDKSQMTNDKGWRPLGELFRGPGESTVDATREIITAVRFRPTGEHAASAFARVMRPQGVALPILGMAVKARRRMKTAGIGLPQRGPVEQGPRGPSSENDGGVRIEEIAISVGPVAPVPFRASRTEAFLRGKEWGEDVLEQATRVLLSEVAPRSSPHRATKEYRLELLPSLLSETLGMAIERLRT